MADTVDLEKLKVADLKKLCKEHGLAATGKKEELIARLSEKLAEDPGAALLAEEGEDEVGEEGEDEVGSEDDGLNETAEDDDLNDDLLGVEDEEEEAKVEATKTVIAAAVSTTKVAEEAQAPAAKPTITKIEFGSKPASDEKAANTTTVTAEEKLAMRAQKFGVQSEDAKKAMRAARFGLPASNNKPSSGSGGGGGSAASIKADSKQALSPEDLEKLKKRAERFGTITSTSLSDSDKLDKMKKRAERFGTITSTTLSKEDEKDKILKRKARFSNEGSNKGTTPDADEAKRKRAERFGLNK